MESSTKILRRLLDERGVEYEGGKRSVRWRDRNGVMMQAFPLADGELGMEVWSCTPEQAIAATMGDVPCLPHFWTHDGVLHVELPKLPESISVRLPDQRDREVGSARVWQYTLIDADATPTRQDDGTCHDTGTFKSWGLFTCSNCSIVIPLNAAKDARKLARSCRSDSAPTAGERWWTNEWLHLAPDGRWLAREGQE